MKKERIEKAIHYCWFGGADLPDSAKKCIASWRKYFPDYEICEWNESNFNIDAVPYIREAYDNKKYAFVSDYARLKVIYDYGGIYFDTDVEVVKRFNDEMIVNGFYGLEDGKIATGLGFSAKKHSRALRLLLDEYEKIHFETNGKLNFTSCVDITTRLLKQNGYSIKPFSKIDGAIIYPEEFFNPIDYKTGKITKTDNTFSIHHYAATWTSEKSKKLKEMKYELIDKYGKTIGRIIYLFKKQALAIKDASAQTKDGDDDA